MIPIAFAGAIVVYLLMRLTEPSVSADVVESAINARVGGITEQRGMVTFTTLPDGREWNVWVRTIGDPHKLAHELDGRADSVRKGAGEQTIEFFVNGAWYTWIIDMPDEE